MKIRIIFLLNLPFFLVAEDSVSNSDLNRKLDLIINKVGGLEQRISKLESENILVGKKIKQVEKKADEAKSSSFTINPSSENEKEHKSLLSRLRLQLKSDEIKTKGPWTQKETWEKVKTNLTEFKIRKLLGNPTTIKTSLNPRIERVYYYYGDLNADGKDENGYVNFFRERVVSFKTPF